MNSVRSLARSLYALSFIVLLASCNKPDTVSQTELRESLSVNFEGNASIEVGSPYAGLEFHHSSPMPQRISFYYPVANSIDMSTDYWTRDEAHSMVAALKTGEGDFEWIGLEPYKTEQTPYYVKFDKSYSDKEITIAYDFLKTSKAFQVSYTIRNTGTETETYELYTDLQAALKTSHTYALKTSAWTEFHEKGSSLIINYDDPEVGEVRLYAVNTKLQPTAYDTRSTVTDYSKQGTWWEGTDLTLNNSLIPETEAGPAAFRYRYTKKLAPGETMEVVQIIGTTTEDQPEKLIGELSTSAQKEIDAYQDQVLNYVQSHTFVTGDSILDHSVQWSNAILDVNRHYIDGSIQPMPCPAQYNFYFTHDVLLTDLSAVNFDLPRVKSDLEFIIKHADESNVIPHAYYWKDNKFQTEIAPPDNWNHFWFVIVSASYLRHSGDTEFLKELYPYLQKSVHDFSLNKKDGIIYSFRPDWWDIARNFGPRSYTTILASKALRDFQYISSTLGRNSEKLVQREKEIEQMYTDLNAKLWDEDQKYLTNFFEDGSQDEHYYIGSLLGSHYGMLDSERIAELTRTAENVLVDPKIGVYTVYPMDFQNLIEYLKLSGNEAGDPNYYINGGIWPHGNAWYLLSMIESGDKKGAYEFIRDIMTVKGVMNSPNGYPAMYEYRVSKKEDPQVYGKIDKPQFTWAAGWYLYGLYNLFGIKETEWNIRFTPFLFPEQKEVRFDLTHSGRKLDVLIQGEGEHVGGIRLNGKEYYSLVLPDQLPNEITKVDISLTGKPAARPLLRSVSAKLNSVQYHASEKSLEFALSGFSGHKIHTVLSGPSRPVSVSQNGTELDGSLWSYQENESDSYTFELNTIQRADEDNFIIRFE